MGQSNILLFRVRVAKILRIWTVLESRKQSQNECFLKDQEDVWKLQDDKDFTEWTKTSLGMSGLD